MQINTNPTPPDAVPSSVVVELNQLDDESLRTVLDYGQTLLNTRIETGPNEEIVSVEDHGTHTTVIKRESCADGCDDCPHGPYLYHIRSEEHINGEENLHWVYIGEVVDECTS